MIRTIYQKLLVASLKNKLFGLFIFFIFSALITIVCLKPIINPVSAADTLTCGVSPFSVKSGDEVTVTATVNFDASAVWAIVENRLGTIKQSHLNLTSTDDINYSASFAVDSSYEGKNHIAVYATINGGDTLLCNASDGIDWINKGTSYMPWTGRGRHKVVTFKNKLWLIGGFDARYLTDVWNSNDGENWTLVTKNAPWGGQRTDYGVVVFDGKIWLMGGFTLDNTWTNLTLTNDIWSTSDGINWTREIEHADWPDRSNFGLTEYNGQLWLSGGCVNITAGACMYTDDDIWTSSNGVDWSLVKDGAASGRRGYHDMYTAETPTGLKMFMIGGIGNNNGTRTWLNNSYSSTDGETWTVADSSIWESGRAYPQVAKLTIAGVETAFVMSGLDSLGNYYNDVYSSAVGGNWTETKADVANPGIGVQISKWTHWDKRIFNSVTTFNDKIFVIGGTDKMHYSSDVWSSTDGNNYTLVNDAYGAQFGHRFATNMVTYNGKMWVIGGMVKTGDANWNITNDVWVSTDGITWTCEFGSYTSNTHGITCAHDTPGFAIRWGHELVVQGSKLYLIGGCGTKNTDFTNCPVENRLTDVWELDDSTHTWTNKNASGLGGFYEASAASYNGNLYVTGYNMGYYSTNNGANWSAIHAPEYSYRVGHEMLVYDNKLWTMGGWDDLESVRKNDVWYTTDPINGPWVEATPAAPWRGRYTFGLVNYDNKMWVLGGNATGSGWPEYLGTNEVWYSTNGVDWSAATTNAAFPGRDFFNATVFADRIWMAGGDTNAATDNTVWASTFNPSFFLMQTESGSVMLSASVDPSMSFSITSNDCAFAPFDSLQLRTCSYGINFSSNSTGGYVAYVRSSDDLKSGEDVISNVADGFVTPGYEEYGIATSDTDYATLDVNKYVENCSTYNNGTNPMPAAALTTTDKSFATGSVPVNNDSVSLCHAVAITGGTEAGNYSQTVTITFVSTY